MPIRPESRTRTGLPCQSASLNAYSIRARVCGILDTLANATNGAHTFEVAESTNLPTTSAFRYLAALEGRHCVERREEAGICARGPALHPQNGA